MAMYRKINITKLLIYLIALTTISCNSTQKNQEVLSFNNDSLFLQLKIIDDNIIGVSWLPAETSHDSSLIVLENEDEAVAYTKSESGNTTVIETGALKIEIDRSTGHIAFYKKDGSKFLHSGPVHFNGHATDSCSGNTYQSIKQEFTFSQDEGLFGLGQFQDGTLNYRGKEILLAHSNTCAAVPFLISSLRYGILWDNYSKTLFRDTDGESSFWSEAGKKISYYVVAGSSMDQVISGYRQLTGKAPILPKWAYGYWQSKERYTSGNDLLAIAKKYRDLKLPIDVIVQDWSYWGKPEYFSGMCWDADSFPNPKETFTSLKQDYNLHSMISIWPAFGEKSEIYAQMKSKGFLYPKKHWSPSLVYDAYHPEARELYWDFIRDTFYMKGLDGWWLDGTEPEFQHTGGRFITEYSMKENGCHNLGSFTEYLNTFSYITSKGVYENQMAGFPDKRVCILTRSAFAGQQKYSAITWSGDIFSNWDVLKYQITAGLNLCMAGIPYWTSDIGGFIANYWFPQGVKDPAYKELYIRWFQYGTFCPIFRSHGTSTPREVWQFGQPGSKEFEALKKSLRLRYLLMPYIYSLAGATYFDDYTLMRGLVMDFPDDTQVYDIKTQFMFGPSIMVCPVTRSMENPQKKVSEFLPYDRFYGSDGKTLGWDLVFQQNTDNGEKELALKCENPNLTWFGAVPDEFREAPYNLTYHGSLLAPKTGKYTFNVSTDGGIVMSLGGKTLINNPNNTENRTFSFSFDMDSNRFYDVAIAHYQPRKQHAHFTIEWTRPGHAQDIHSPKGLMNVYLPGSNAWYDFWTGDKLDPNTNIEVQTILDHIPIYVKAGSIIPLGDAAHQHTAEVADTLEIRIYPGADAFFEYYDDKGEGNAYKTGEYLKIPFTWNEAGQTLTIGNMEGSLGSSTERPFTLVNMQDAAKHGMAKQTGKTQTVLYTGKELTLNF
jgi:alpha-D-xyloside xylohydrolase